MRPVEALFDRLARHLGGTRVLALPVLRLLAVLAAVTWLALAPAGFPQRPALTAATLAFTAYSGLIFLGLWRRPHLTLGHHRPVLVTDLAFALLFIHLTGGARSTMFLALLLIAGLQAYYYGTRRGVLVALGSSVAYLAVIWPTVSQIEVPNLAIRFAVLLGTAVGVGLLGDMEARERQAVEALTREARIRERFIRSVLDSLREGVVALDEGGRIVAWNPAMEERYGIAAGEVVGRELFEALPHLRGGPLEEPLRALLAGRQVQFTLEGLEHQSRRRGRVVVNVQGSLLQREGRPAGAVLLVEDITQRVALEQSARQVEKLAALGTMAAGLAHELNNPIGIISSRIELMLLDAESRPLPEDVEADLRVLHRHAQRVARVAQGLLSFARRAPGRRGPVDLNHLVEETLLLLERQMARRGIALKRALAPELPPVEGDANALQQVLVNLLANARDAVGEGGEVSVETAAVAGTPPTVRLVVRDTGPGIPPDVLPRIFDPFFTTRPDGTGLGLSISYGIVREHGGTLEVDSAPGQGAAFTVTLPAAGGGAA